MKHIVEIEEDEKNAGIRMSEMTNGQIGVLTDSGVYNGRVVMRQGIPDGHGWIVADLVDGRGWTQATASGRVRILPPGTRLSIVVGGGE